MLFRSYLASAGLFLSIDEEPASEAKRSAATRYLDGRSYLLPQPVYTETKESILGSDEYIPDRPVMKQSSFQDQPLSDTAPMQQRSLSCQ